MMITKIIEYDKKKVLVQVDEHFTFPLYKTELQKYSLVEERDIPSGIYQEIIGVILPKRVKVRAMKLLEKRAYTREMLKRKLLEGRYPLSIVEEALDYVTAYHYIDDVTYTEEYIHSHISKYSKKEITQKLKQKGISRKDIETGWLQYEKANEPIDEMEQIKVIFSKKHFDIHTADYKEKCKMFQYLYRKGYDPNCIQNCMQFEGEYGN